MLFSLAKTRDFAREGFFSLRSMLKSYSFFSFSFSPQDQSSSVLGPSPSASAEVVKTINLSSGIFACIQRRFTECKKHSYFPKMLLTGSTFLGKSHLLQPRNPFSPCCVNRTAPFFSSVLPSSLSPSTQKVTGQYPLLAPSVRHPQMVWRCVFASACVHSTGIVWNELIYIYIYLWICQCSAYKSTSSLFCPHTHTHTHSHTIWGPWTDGAKVDIASDRSFNLTKMVILWKKEKNLGLF